MTKQTTLVVIVSLRVNWLFKGIDILLGDATVKISLNSSALKGINSFFLEQTLFQKRFGAVESKQEVIKSSRL